MRRLHYWALAAFLPVAILLTSMGCNGKKDGDAPKEKPSADNASKDKTDGGGEVKPLAIKARGTLKGKVTLASAPGDLDKKTAELQEQMKKHKDGAKCMAGSPGEITQQDYRIGEGNGLADVFVWVKPSGHQYFQLEKSDLELKDVKPGDHDIKAKEIIVDQPHCAFIPHAFAVFPKYNDGKGLKPTGQKLIIKNDAEFPHNTNWKGGPRNRGDNKLIPAGGQIEVPALNPDETPVLFKCDLHTWMQAVARVYDHPFVAITDKNGNFEIKDVPAGVDLQVIAWHPAITYLNTEKGEKINIKEGAAETKNFEAKAK